MVFVTDQDQPQTPSNMITPSFLSKSQIWEQFVSENVQNEVELLKSRASIAENLVAEKSKQLEIVQVWKELFLSADFCLHNLFRL